MNRLEEIMGEEYQPDQFWTDSGREYWRTDIVKSPEHVEQEALLRSILEPLEFTTVLDVGCGGGRLGRLIRDIHPHVRYTGIDISDKALEVARTHLSEAELIHSSIQRFEPGGRTWDLVLSSEVLMHVQPVDFDATLAKLMAMGKIVLAVEWVVRGSMPSEVAPWNWPHDYAALGDPIAFTGEQAVYLWRQ